MKFRRSFPRERLKRRRESLSKKVYKSDGTHNFRTCISFDINLPALFSAHLGYSKVHSYGLQNSYLDENK